jgi:hypothetical protein
MATKSILKTVYIKDSETARRLANALENASQWKTEPVNYKRSVSTATRKEIRAMFLEEKAE